MKGIKKGLAILLVLCTLLSMVVMTGAGAAPQSADAPEAQTMAANDGFMKMVLLDGGRGHISVENVKAVINEMALYDYDYLMLGIGNDGLRFLLDDMSVTANDQTYSGETIKNAIVAKNNELAPKARGEWSETDMNTILAYAREKGISIVPMLNTPGHATSIVAAMTACGITNCSLASSGTDTKNITINIENEQAAAFAKALVKKYITWFSSRGCTYFNLGCDEYGGNAGNTQDKTNQAITAYVTDLCNAMTAMTPMAFTDVLCACSNVPDNLVGIHWYKNKLQNNSNVRANSNWYYVVGTHGTGNPNEWATYEKALKCVATDRVEEDYDGSLLAIWNDYNNPFTAEEVANVKTLIRTQATSNPDYFTSLPKTETVEDTIPVGTSKPYTQDGHVGIAGTYTTSDGIASYTIKHNTNTAKDRVETTRVDSNLQTGTYLIGNGTQWLKLNGSNLETTTDPAEATQWTITKSGDSYTIQSGGYYLGWNPRKTSSWGTDYYSYTLVAKTDAQTWSYNNGFYSYLITEDRWVSDKYNNYYLGYNNGWQMPTTNSSNDAAYTFETIPGTATDSTTITFTGVKPGTTAVEIGGTLYKITVEDEVPADAKKDQNLTIEYWITNHHVYQDSNTSSASSKTISSTAASSEEGVSIRDYAPGEAYSNFTGAMTKVYFWQAVRLDKENQQTTTGTDDETADGVALTHVRYHNNAWQYQAQDGIWRYFLSGDQLVAYYLQKTEVDPKIGIDIYTKDWGFRPSATQPSDEANGQQVGLSIAVVYPDNTIYPPEKAGAGAENVDLMSNSTTIFNWWNNENGKRDIGIIAPMNNGDYEISKITVTSGTYTGSKANNGWWTSTSGDVFDWEMKTNEAGKQWYDEKVVWDEVSNAGTTPMVNGVNSDIRWPGANTAKLVLIYLKPIEKETNLNVVYRDDTDHSTITQFQIAMTYNQGDTEPSYISALHQDSPVKIGPITLDDNAYVTNSSGGNQTFNKDVSIISGIDGKYSSGLYQYVGADISADGKTLTLHYNINSENLNKNYIVDFGLPVEVPLTDLVSSGATVARVEVTGNAAYADGQITYTPAAVLTGTDVITVKVSYQNSTHTDIFRVGFMPATTVYYEEGFATPYNSDATGGSKGAVAQTTEVVGKKQNVYGYDDAYNKVGDSNDSVMTLAAGKGAATFTFTGTGVDIYTRSTMETGSLMIRVMNSANKLVKVVSVNTVMKNGSSDSTSGQEVTAYNVPVVSLSGLTHGTYTLQIAAVKSGSAGAKDVYIDGFRVHGTLEDQSNSVYVADQEDNPTFVELRDEVLTAQNVNTDNSQYANQIAENVISQVYAVSNSTTGAVIMSNNTKLSDADMEDLLDNGPKNEIYLQPQQTLTFKISTNRVVQIGLKALNQATTYTINNDEKKPLNTSTDMFYTVLNKAESETEQTITITNTGNGILSITDLKVCDDPNATLGELTAEDLIPALVSLGFESEPVAATATLNITVQCGDKAVPVTLTHDGMSNETHTFTAAEIKAAVEQALPEGYTVADVTFSDVTVTCGEASDVAFTAAETPAPVGLLQKIVQIAVKIVKKIFSWF